MRPHKEKQLSASWSGPSAGESVKVTEFHPFQSRLATPVIPGPINAGADSALLGQVCFASGSCAAAAFLIASTRISGVCAPETAYF
jgi:hypothetical protein